MTMPSPFSWLDPLLVVWFVLTALSVAYVAWDVFTRSPELKVMKWGWILVTLYGGPIMAAAYVLSCQEPATNAMKSSSDRCGNRRLAPQFIAWPGMRRA